MTQFLEEVVKHSPRTSEVLCLNPGSYQIRKLKVGKPRDKLNTQAYQVNEIIALVIHSNSHGGTAKPKLQFLCKPNHDKKWKLVSLNLNTIISIYST